MIRFHHRRYLVYNLAIDTLRKKYNDIKDFSDNFFPSLQKEMHNQNNGLFKPKTKLQNKAVIAENYRNRANMIINNHKVLLDEYDNIEEIDFESIFSIAVIISKELIYFIVGSGNIKNPPLDSKLLFTSSIVCKVRKASFTSHFGMLIRNK